MPAFDLAVIGAGPGGFEAALHARELGLKVALIDKADPGGTCLHTGCIPTKSLLASTKLISRIARAESLGLSPAPSAWDWPSLIQRKNRVVDALQKGMMETLKRSGVEWISGSAAFVSKHLLKIEGGGEMREVSAENTLIATGSEPTPFPGAPFDGERILSSADLLNLQVPIKQLLILGGGVVGVEFASMFQPLGTKVTLVEMLDRLIAAEDEEISRRLESLFKRRGIDVQTGQKVKTLSTRGGKIEALLESGSKIEADRVLVAAGRKPVIDGLNLEKVGVKIERGRIVVDEYLQTSVPGIFAVGDVTDHSTGLAHGASAEGIRVVENLKGPRRPMDYQAIPNCIYTDPEVASVGARRAVPLQGTIECKILFASLGRPQAEGETEGFLKMTASKKNGRILRVSAIGAHVTELIHEAVLAVKCGLTVKDLAGAAHAHPTASEIFQRAAGALSRLTR